jgi:hypothetical protein
LSTTAKNFCYDRGQADFVTNFVVVFWVITLAVLVDKIKNFAASDVSTAANSDYLVANVIKLFTAVSYDFS